MRKLKLFRIIGESYAKTYAHPDRAMLFFKETAEHLYPENKHRREWAISNMQMFFEQEVERTKIMDTLSGKPGDNILEQIRKRQNKYD